MVRTRRQAYNYRNDGDEDGRSKLTSGSASASQRPETLIARRQRWAAHLRAQNYQSVIMEVLQEELPKYTSSSTIGLTPLPHILRECILILSSAPSVFTAAVEGALARQLHIDAILQAESVAIHQRAHSQPSIYIHLLADEHGVAPSANQYMIIRETVMEYLSNDDHEVAWLIDNITPPSVSRSSTAQGHRKYLWTTHRSPQHVRSLQHFCAGILSRYLETPASERETPFAYPPGECGYSISAPLRLAQHRRHQSSNYIMNLTEDICAYLYSANRLPRRFTMHQFIIYLIFRPSQVAIAEIFCSGLLQVWIENGGGFNAYPAGRSVASAGRVGVRQWRDFQRSARVDSRLAANLGVQREILRLKALDLAGDTDAEEAWREALESESESEGDDVTDLDWLPGDGDEHNYECV
ncbi:hypothetical protein BDV95DRAFT_495898 [Massariosphaeria phaeospora]|uniref:Uncharacterized protein n=1 Tax=Massariosphaeria phaeospora TaxID=100035 RepID=A0A7C8MIZ7_9PLEO|nr:hypothetical protein BDV95DRAFT_495898 [Massariosphaeria phaeospora]